MIYNYPIKIHTNAAMTKATGYSIDSFFISESVECSIDEAIDQASRTVDLALASLEGLPQAPHPIDSQCQGHFCMWFIYRVDVSPFMGASEKINVTLPSLLTHQIDKLVDTSAKYKSRSHFLQVAATKLLGDE